MNEGVIKIGDFGMAKKGLDSSKSVIGSYVIMAPELF